MRILLIVLQFTSAIGLIISVLLHSAKGEGLGSIGGPAKLFSSQKALEAGLNKITGVLAGVFILLSLILSVGNF